MGSMSTDNMDNLISAELWSTQLKEILQDQLMGNMLVDWLEGFPDGSKFTIPSVGNAVVDNYIEDEEVKMRPLDTGEFNFVISTYLSSGHYITDKAKLDSYYAKMLESSFVPKESRAILEKLETDIFALQSKQTAGGLNAINGANHRKVAGGTGNIISYSDFAYMSTAFDLANVSRYGRVAFISPWDEYNLNTSTTIVASVNNPMFEGLITTGFSDGIKFYKNIFGWDIYVTNYLADIASETVNSVPCTNAKACVFASLDPASRTFLGAWRQQPTVEYNRNVLYKRDEYTTTAMYGLDLYRPEAFGVLLTEAS